MASLVSLIDLAHQRANLSPPSKDSIHYPETGTAQLGQMELNHFWFVQRRKLILYFLKRYLLPSSLGSVVGIDMGCGTGFNAVWLTENGFPTLGMDAYDGFSQYQKKGDGLGFVQGDLFSADFKPEFDFALALDVLEHIPDDKAFVNKLTQLIKPGGLLIFTMPAFSWLWSAEDERADHLRRYTDKELENFKSLDSTRLERLYRTYFYLTLLPFYLVSRLLARNIKKKTSLLDEAQPAPIINFFFKILLKIEGALARRIPLPLGSSLFVVYRKPL